MQSCTVASTVAGGRLQQLQEQPTILDPPVKVLDTAGQANYVIQLQDMQLGKHVK